MATAKRHDAYIVAGSAERAIFIAAADRVGTERGQPFVGSSLICSRTGWPIAGPASKTEAETIMADLNLSEARRKRNWNDSTRSCAIAGPTSTARCSAPA